MTLPFRLPGGIGLLSVGSGVYWTLSSQLIGSPTALAPGLLQGSGEIFLLFCVGIACIVAGLPLLISDFGELRSLFQRQDGWLFTIPIGLAAADIELTLIGLSTGRAVELNPFVSATATAGPGAILLFLLSYLSLSEGLGVLMFALGVKVYGSSRRERNLPFALVCGAAAFGPFSNLGLLALGSLIPLAGFFVGASGSCALAYQAYSHLKN